MKNLGLVLVLALTVAIAVPAADQALLNAAPPDAKVLLGADLERMKATPFGRFLLEQMPKESKDFDQFIQATGFDPRRDLQEVLITSSTPPSDAGRPTKGLILARGVFDAERIRTLIKNMGGAPITYQGMEIIPDKKHGTDSAGLVFLTGSVAAAGDMDSLKAAIDRQKQGGTLPAATVSRAQELSANNHIWLLTSMPVAQMAGKVPDTQASGVMKGDAFKGIEQIAAGLNFGDSKVKINAEATAKTEKDASAMGDVVKFLTGMIQLNRDKKDVAEVAAILDTLDIQVSGNTLKLSISVPEEQLEKMIRSKQKPATQAANSGTLHIFPNSGSH